MTERWGLRSSFDDDWHAVVTESTTGMVACGDSWCTGTCGYPALVHEGKKAHGVMVACGMVWQPFRVDWTGARVEATAPGEVIADRWWW